MGFFEKVGGNQEGGESLYHKIKSITGKTIEVPGSAVNLPDQETVSVSVSGVIERPGEDGKEYILKVIPTQWEEEHPDKKFGTEALDFPLDNPREFIREHNLDA